MYVEQLNMLRFQKCLFHNSFAFMCAYISFEWESTQRAIYYRVWNGATANTNDHKSKTDCETSQLAYQRVVCNESRVICDVWFTWEQTLKIINLDLRVTYCFNWRICGQVREYLKENLWNLWISVHLFLSLICWFNCQFNEYFRDSSFVAVIS